MLKYIISLCLGVSVSVITEAAEVKFAAIETERAGQLEELLGDRIYEIDSLSVKGPLNRDDEATLRLASFNGKLRVWNLAEAQLEGNKFSGDAYSFRHSEASRENPPYYRVNPVRRVILPEDVEVIGNGAFAFCTYLEEVNIPSSVREIGSTAFFQCMSLGKRPFELPEGVERVYEESFARCENLRELRFPSSLKRIDELAFYESGLENVDFSEGLEYLGENAFACCNYLREAVLPTTCRSLAGRHHFVKDSSLEKLYLSEGIDSVPQNFAWQCRSLKEVRLPQTMRVIGGMAFGMCVSLKSIELNEGLAIIEGSVFDGCVQLQELVLPSTLEKIGYFLDGMPGLTRLCCKALCPPELSTFDYQSWYFPMSADVRRMQSAVEQDKTPQDIPVYVPRGSAEAYRNAPGWNYFTNFIETDEFPEAGIDGAWMEDGEVEVRVASGRVVLAGNGAAASDYAVLTIDGRRVAAGSVSCGDVVVSVATGLYIVAVGATAVKVFVP